MKKLFLTSLALLLCSLSLSAQNVGEAFYVYRNDGQFNAFFRSEVDSIVYSYEDAAGNRYDDIVTQCVYTADSLYQIPLSAIDSVAFVAPSTVYKEDVVQLTGDLFDYVISVEGQVIRLSPDVPKKLMPAVGDKIGTAELTDKIPYGFSGEVKSVATSTDGSILVSCEEIPIEEVVDRLFAEFNAVSSDEAEEALRRRMPRAFKRTRIFKIDLPREIPMNADLSPIIKKGKVLDYGGAAKATLTLRPDLIVTSTVVISRELGLYIKNVATLDVSTTEDIDIVGQVSTQDAWGKNKLKKEFFGGTYPLAFGIGVYGEAGVKAEASGEFGIGGTFNQNWRSTLTVEFSTLRPDMRTVSFDNRQLSRDAHWKHVVGRAEAKVCGYFGLGFALIEHKIAKVGAEFDGGLKIEAEAEVDIEALTQANRTTKLYDTLEPVAKVDLAPYVGAYFKASLLDDRISFRAGRDWEWGPRWLQLRLLPSFSDVKAEKTKTGAIVSSNITNDMLLPTKVGFTAIGDDGTSLPTVFEDWSYWDRASFSSYKLELTGLKGGTTYKIYPTVRFLGKWDMLASPYAELRTDVPVRITDFKVTKSQHAEDGFTYDGRTYSYRFDAATTVSLDNGAEVYDWGYVYEDPQGKQVHISLKGFASPYTDTRYVYYRNAARSTVRFIPYARYSADGEYDYGDLVEFDLVYSTNLCPDAHHPHKIDMGDAGTWACCNVGASSPTDYGGYYAWGETEQKSDYSYTTYKFWHDYNGDGDWDWDDGEFDNLGDIAGNKQYDVAAAKWGGQWKIPTIERMKLLAACSSEWKTINGVNGRLFTASNGHHIFLPAAGYRERTGLYGDGNDCCYWSSTPYPSYGYYASGLYFFSDGANWIGYFRCGGHSVRPVAE